MQITMGLSHLAVSVPSGTLTPDWRSAFFDFYGAIFGWTEIKKVARADRLTVAIGGSCYLSIRERLEPMACTEFEHFGLVVKSADYVEHLWSQVNMACSDVDDIKRRRGGTETFKFRHMLPLTMEIQYLSNDDLTVINH